ncbi:ATM interactor [Phlebotomus argentipes]|uniref:ATM interactor n=1 Tax=Phlebotomus argentipes TaxID=94469 RepID=UPI00289339A1|nr:ATM interactor [Phlebotomus argentipes]
MNRCEENSTNGKLFCPFVNCNYNGDKHFLQRKHLKQHLLKVHTAKNYKCDQCRKAFSTQNFLMAHVRQCGKEFKCSECEWVFKSREALLTHARRRGHRFEEVTDVKLPEKVKLMPKESPQKADQCVQTTSSNPTSPAAKRKFTQTTQTSAKRARSDRSPPDSPKLTDNSSQTPELSASMMDFFDDSLSIFPGHFDGSQCSTETQTDRRLPYSQSSRTSGADPLLCHMYTQTCDEILSELGLSDVQTQTTWPPSEFQDFLVSTETQTSFTQCLEEEIASFTTQHTQT